MIGIFKRKKNRTFFADMADKRFSTNPTYTYSDFNHNRSLNDNKMARLMELISLAINIWVQEYNLENLPPKIIFEQALDAMSIIELTFKSKN